LLQVNKWFAEYNLSPIPPESDIKRKRNQKHTSEQGRTQGADTKGWNKARMTP